MNVGLSHSSTYSPFTVLQVEDKLVQNFNLVAGYVPVLKEYMEDVNH